MTPGGSVSQWSEILKTPRFVRASDVLLPWAIRTKTVKKAWRRCTDPEWMLYFLARLYLHKPGIDAMTACLRTAIKRNAEHTQETRIYLSLVEGWLKGHVQREYLMSAMAFIHPRPTATCVGEKFREGCFTLMWCATQTLSPGIPTIVRLMKSSLAGATCCDVIRSRVPWQTVDRAFQEVAEETQKPSKPWPPDDPPDDPSIVVPAVCLECRQKFTRDRNSVTADPLCPACLEKERQAEWEAFCAKRGQ